VSPAEAIVRLNDGRERAVADAVRRLAWRAGNAWRLARRRGLGALVERVRP
jgi:hypothetical protein